MLDGKCLLLEITLAMEIAQSKEESWFMMSVVARGEVIETETQ